MKRLNDIWKRGEVLLSCNYDKYSDELTLLMKDSKTNNKNLYTLRGIEIPIYIAKKGEKIPYHLVDIDIDRVDEVWIKNAFKEWNIADKLGIKSFSRMVKEGKITKDEIYLNRNLFNADLDVSDRVMRSYVQYYSKLEGELFITEVPTIPQFHIGVFDIETDVRNTTEQKDQPVIMNSYVDGKDFTCFSGCLINPEFKGQKEIMENPEQFKKEMKEFLVKYLDDIDLDILDEEKKKRKEELIKGMMKDLIDNITFEIHFFEDERDLLIKTNQHIFNKKKPDFLLAYNAQYDIKQQELRANELGVEIKDMMGIDEVKDFKYFFNYYNQNPKAIKRFHNYYTKNMTKILDYMLVYYQLRRAHQFSKQSLDATAKREIGVGKLDFTHICNWIGDLPYEDYKTYLMYNIMDNISLLMTEKVTNDIFLATYTRFNNMTDWEEVFKPMVSVTNVFNGLKELQGKISGNNINALLLGLPASSIKTIKERDPALYNVAKQLKEANVPKEERKKPEFKWRVPGGYVSDPNGISKLIKKGNIYSLEPKNWFKFGYSADSDAKSMYPSNMKANNSSKTTLFGVISKVNNFNKYGKDTGHMIALSLINKNYSNMGHYLFSLPDTETLIKNYYGIERKAYKKLQNIGNLNKDDDIYFENDSKNKELASLKLFWNNMYNTKFNDTDERSGRPSLNTLFMTDDSKHIEFSYYDTLVQLDLDNENEFNKLCGLHGKGFICGHLINKEDRIKNYNREYVKFLYPKNNVDDLINKLELLTEGILGDEVLEEISNAKTTPIKINFDDVVSLNCINRLLFFNYKYCKSMKYKVYGNFHGKEYLLQLFTTFIHGKIRINVTQSIIVLNR